MIEVNKNDEIQTFKDSAYTSASQAEWELQGYVTSFQEPDVVKLPVHLENEQFVMFNEDDELKQVMEKSEKTMLTEFFTLNKEDPEANRLIYNDVVRYYTFNKKDKKWVRRKRNTIRANIVAKNRGTDDKTSYYNTLMTNGLPDQGS